MAHLYEGSPAELARIDQVQRQMEAQWGDQCAIFRATPRIIDVQAKGVSKGLAALDLKKQLGRKILVCVGDEGNDVAMLQGADFAFCPSDGAVAADFPNVCPCSEGAVADVIYNEIPKILKG